VALAGFRRKKKERPYRGREKAQIAKIKAPKRRRRRKKAKIRKTMTTIMAEVCFSH
jgi:hypothetical protein